MQLLEIITCIITILTFSLLIVSKFFQFFSISKREKTVVRFPNKNDQYIGIYTLDQGESKIVLYNQFENIFDIEFYRIKDYNNKLIRENKHQVPCIKKLVCGEKILIITDIPDTFPNLEIVWRTESGEIISAIILHNGRDGLSLSFIKYRQNLLNFLYFFFK